MQLADLARSDGAATRFHQARLDPGDQRTHGVVASRRLRPDARDSGGAFGDAVAVAQWQPEFRLDLGFQRHVERRAGDSQPAKFTAGQPVDPGERLVFQQPLIRRRHTEEQRDDVIGNRRDQRGRIVARHQLHGGADHQRRDQDGRVTDDVRYRQNAVDLVRRLALRARNPCAEQHIAVGQHHPFGISGRARGIDECGDLTRPIHLNRLWHRITV